MSISSTTRKAGPFAGNGAQTDFPFAFKVFAASDMVVVSTTASVETTKALTTDYTVTLNADQDNTPGGTIHMVVAPPNGTSVTFTSDVPATQAVEVTNGGGFFPAVFNAVFDRLTILCQQIAEKVSRSLTIPISATGVTSLQIPVLASGVLIWKPDGTAIQCMTLPSLASFLALPNTAGKSGQFLTNDGAGNFSWSPVAAAVPTSRTISAAGLATGGGALTADRTITVPKAAGTDVQANDDTKAVTGKALFDAMAFGTLTDAATVAWNVQANDGSGGINAQLTLTANGHTIGQPTNMKDGATYTLNINPATFTVAWHASWDFGAAGAPTMAASKWNKVTFQYNSGRGKQEASFWKGA